MTPPSMIPASMTPDELEEIAEAIWGQMWQHRMADALDINPRTIRYWMSGQRDIPATILNDFDAFVLQEISRLVELKNTISRKIVAR